MGPSSNKANIVTESKATLGKLLRDRIQPIGSVEVKYPELNYTRCSPIREV